jgi:hypothetical protein
MGLKIKFLGWAAAGVLWATLAARADLPGASGEPEWSKTVGGLRARLFTAPNKETELDKTYDVLIEFQEVGIETSLGLEHRAVTIHCGAGQFQLTVTNMKGATVVPSSLPFGGATRSWDLVLPPGGKLSFPIGQGGSSPHQPPPGQAPPKGALLNFSVLPGTEWLLLLDGGPFKLAGTFAIPAGNAGTPGGEKAWTGTLELPAISIQAK